MAKRRKPGFALLEVLVFLLVLLVLVAALLASAGNLHSRSVRRVESDRAYYAALAAVRMVAGDIVAGGSTAAFSAKEMTLSVEDEGEMKVTVSSTGEKTDALSGQTFLTLSATAAVGSETQTVEMKLQKLPKDEIVPATLFGSGFAGALENYEAPFTWDLGSDTDLCLFSAGKTVKLAQDMVGGNLIVRGGALEAENASVGGMIVSDGDVTLKNTVVGEEMEPTQTSPKRMAGVCLTDGKLTLETGTKLGGPAYAPAIEAGDGVSVNGDLYCAAKTLREQAVFAHDGAPKYTSESKLGRFGGLVFAGGHTWQTLQSGALAAPKALLAAGPQLFVPNFPADMEQHHEGTTTVRPDTPSTDGVLYIVENKAMLTLTAAPPDSNNRPAIFVILGEGSTLMLEGSGNFYLNVYGTGDLSDPNKKSEFKVDNTNFKNVIICGTLQNVEMDTSSGGLCLRTLQPTKLAFQTPASGGRLSASWAVVETTQRPGA